MSIRPEINQIADSIAADNQYKSSGVGYGGVRTSQWERFLTLKDKAKSEELRQLTNHTNSVVRCYSFQALAERQDSMTFSILLNHLKDNEYVSTFQGCIVSSSTVGDFFVNIVTPKYISLSAYKLKESEQQNLDSLLIFDPKIKLSAKSRLLKDLQPKPQYHERVRQIAKEERNPTAAITLARFQDEADIDIIKGFFKKEKTEYYAIYAAREFPHKEFYTELVKIFEREWKEKYYDYSKWRILYQALAKYDNQQTLEFFERTINAKKKFRRQTLGKYLIIAITKYPTKNFEDLKPKIKLDDYYMDAVLDEMNIEK
tara:strand:- start:235 stop:1179 length:945 start_codon:yes stop_codon:yes gene_type:complete